MTLSAKTHDKLVFYKQVCLFPDIKNWIEYPENNNKVCKSSICKIDPFVVSSKKKLKEYEEDPKYYIHENKPVSLKFIGYEGKKPIVVINDEFYYHISHDVLLNAASQSGLQKNKKVPGEFIFITINKKHKLVKVGSELYKKISQINNIKPLSEDELYIGGLYKKKSGALSVFLGFVSTEVFTGKIDTNWENVKFREIKKGMLWHDIDYFLQTKNDKFIKSYLEKPRNNKMLYRLMISRLAAANFSGTYITEKFSHVKKLPNVELFLPNEHINEIRKKIEYSTNNHLSIATSFSNHISNEEYKKLKRLLYSKSSLMNMNIFGLGPRRSKIYKRYHEKINKLSNK